MRFDVMCKIHSFFMRSKAIKIMWKSSKLFQCFSLVLNDNAKTLVGFSLLLLLTLLSCEFKFFYSIKKCKVVINFMFCTLISFITH